MTARDVSLRRSPFSIAQAIGRTFAVGFFAIGALVSATSNRPVWGQGRSATNEDAACRALEDIRNLTITTAGLRRTPDATVQYCYVKGTISPAIHYHVQLPLPDAWTGRFVQRGDGGKDGDLDFFDDRLAQGYVVANSNTGHDSGSEPRASFAFNNRQAEIDFGYRAVHLLANTAKTVIRAYYERNAHHAYFEGCSSGGRQALTEAQRFPRDFDGIVAGAPVNQYQAINTTHAWMVKKLFENDFSNNLAFDTQGDGVPDSLTKLHLLARTVMDKCDAKDGITDGVIDDPLACDFEPDVELASLMCPGDVNADGCFTRGQIQTIKDIYAGAHDSKGVLVFKGQALGTEPGWRTELIPHAGNKLQPNRMRTFGDHMNYLFYENDPGVPPPDLTDLSYVPNKHVNPPEYAWWEFDIDDITSGKGDFMKALTDSTDPDLTRFLKDKPGKLLLYHGWGDATAQPEPTLDYFNAVVATTFQGDAEAAHDAIRLFMAPGMGHCDGGPGPNTWDRLQPLVDWVEQGRAPEFIVASHLGDDGAVDNERKICPEPQRAIYTGPEGGQNDPVNWVSANFSCR